MNVTQYQLDLDEPNLPGQNMAGGFDGADRISRELAMWNPALRSADAEILPEKDDLDARVVDLERNNGYIHGAVQSLKDSIVGSQYRLNLRPNFRALGLDEVWASEFQEFVESRFYLAGESPSCLLDASGRMTFSEMVRLGLGVSMLSGEVLATSEWLRDSGRPFSTAIQMVDPMRLDNPNEQPDSEFWRKGVNISRTGKPLRYSIRVRAKGEMWGHKDQYEFKIIPARKPWGRKLVIHHFEPFRIDQTRGISQMVSILKQSRMIGRYQDVVLQNAVVNATYAATIESDLPPMEAFETIGVGTEDPTAAWAKNYLRAIAAYTGDSKHLHIDGVKIPHLYPGTKLKMLNPANPSGGLGGDLEKSLMRYLASVFGMSYEEFAHDFTQTNYSSFKAARAEAIKRLQGRKKAIADKFANDVFRLWFEEMFNRGEFKDVLPRNAPSIYEGMNLDAYTSANWIGAPQGQIEELKETQAAIARIEAGLSTYEKECSRLGDDFREVMRQRKREQDLMSSLGLSFSSQNGSKGGNMTGESGNSKEAYNEN